MKENLVKAIQLQINKELFSSYLYLSMSSWANTINLKGVSTWLLIQSQEEHAHAMTLHDNLLERGEKSIFFAIPQPKTEWASLLDCFEEVYSHEKDITLNLNNLASIAMKEEDHTFYHFIQMFLKEQVEEESTCSELVERIKILGDNPAMIYLLSKELGLRVYVDPFPNK